MADGIAPSVTLTSVLSANLVKKRRKSMSVSRQKRSSAKKATCSTSLAVLMRVEKKLSVISVARRLTSGVGIANCANLMSVPSAD